MQSNTKRQLIVVLIAAIGIIVLGWLVYMYLILGKLAVSAPEATTIKVAAVSGGKVQEFKNASSATARVTSGKYIVWAQNANGESFTYAEAKMLKTTTVTLDSPTASLHASVIAKTPTTGATIQAGKLVYTSITDTSVHAMTPPNSDSFLTNTSSQELIAGETDNNGNSYRPQQIAGNTMIVNDGSRIVAIKDGIVKDISLAGIGDFIAPLFAIVGTNPNQASFTITINGTVYFYSSVDAQPQKIVETKKRISHASYGGNTLVLYSTEMPFTNQDITEAYTSNNYAINPVVVDLKNKTTKELSGGPVSDLSVSPNGTTATVRYRNDADMYLLDIANNTTTQTLQAPDGASPVWTSADTFVYEHGGTVREYNTATQKGSALGTISGTATSIVKLGNDYIISTLGDAFSKQTVIRLSTKAVADSVRAAGEKLPLSGNGWKVDYTYIEKPVLLVATESDVFDVTPEQYKKNHQDLRNQALKALRDNGIDPAQFTVRYSPSDAEIAAQ